MILLLLLLLLLLWASLASLEEKKGKMMGSAYVVFSKLGSMQCVCSRALGSH